jgi:putative molybdopterin biosynthesis protein
MKMFRKLVPFVEAKRLIQEHLLFAPVGIEEVSLLGAYDRILAEDISATFNVPPFARSTVDGYAVKAADTFGAYDNKAVKLKIDGAVKVGEIPYVIVNPGTTVEIVTGAPIPKGADSVIMVEHTAQEGSILHVFKAVAINENVMKAGADIKKSETILRIGQSLGSREIGVMAALGKKKVRVYWTPRVAVLSTGAEIIEPGGKLPLGKIFDINAYSICAAVLESGGKPIYLGVFPDDTSKLQMAIKRASVSTDMIITSGGVSIGPTDVMPRTLNSLGKPGVFLSGIAIKPGKPTTIALIDKKLVFSLPGHPTSALLVFHLLISPIIHRMIGKKQEKGLKVKAFTTMKLFQTRGRRTFIMVKLKCDNANVLRAEPVPEGLSGAITTLLKADGFIEIPENQQFIGSNQEVTVNLFRPVRGEETKFSKFFS